MRGFTLVELMIVVAIIGILAAIAIPNFVTMQMKARNAEGPLVVDGLQAEALSSIEPAATVDINSAWNPDDDPGKGLRPWVTGQPTWTLLSGFAPDGEVRCSYAFAVYIAGQGWQLWGQCDADEDDVNVTSGVWCGGWGKTCFDYASTAPDVCAVIASPGAINESALPPCN